MTDLPDLDTSNIGIMAYWNALEHGASYIDPAPAVSYGQVQSFDAYDNGIEGTVQHSFRRKTRNFNFRMKTDGWIVVWMDRQNDATHGYIDLVNDWTDYSTPSTMTGTTLGHQIEQLLANSTHDLPTGNFSHSDVELFSPEYEKTIQGTLFSYQQSTSGSGSSENGDIKWTDDPLIYTAGGSTETDATGENGYVSFDGNKYCSGNSTAIKYWSKPKQTSYSTETYAPANDGTYTTHAKQDHLFLF